MGGGGGGGQQVEGQERERELRVEVRVMEMEKVAKLFFQSVFLPQVLMYRNSSGDFEISGTQVHCIYALNVHTTYNTLVFIGHYCVLKRLESILDGWWLSLI